MSDKIKINIDSSINCYAFEDIDLNQGKLKISYIEDYFCSPCEWFGYVDEVKYLKDKLSCPICNNSELEMNDEK